MPKNNIDEIIKAVERYKTGETSQKAEAKKQGVSHQTVLRDCPDKDSFLDKFKTSCLSQNCGSRHEV